MEKILTINRGDSLSFAFYLPTVFDMTRLISIEVRLGKKLYPHKIVGDLGNIIECVIASDKTLAFPSVQQLSLKVVDSQFGGKTHVVGWIETTTQNVTQVETAINNGYNLFIPTVITQAFLTSGTLLYNILRSKSTYELAVEGGYEGTEQQFYDDLSHFKMYHDETVQAKLDAEIAQLAAEAAALQTTADRVQTGFDVIAANEAKSGAEAAESNSEGWAEQSSILAAAAEAARDKAEQWAENPEDVPVEESPDKFSALHWAAKAEETSQAIHAEVNAVAVAALGAVQSDPTGFLHWNEIDVAYDPVARKVTLTANSGYTLDCYYHGVSIPEFEGQTTWTSDEHADVSGSYFLHYCSGNFIFTTTPWFFDCVHIAFCQYEINNNGHHIGIRETHGLNMDWASHKEFHETVGTYLTAGGDLTGVTLNSTTVAQRRPNISQTTVYDEDLRSAINELTSKQYTQRYITLSGSTNVRAFNVEQSDIVKLSGNQPILNLWDGAAWTDTPMDNNRFAVLFVIAVPVTSDTESQKFRYMFTQPQAQYANVTQAQAILPADIVMGDSSVLVSEFVFIGKIIIQYTGGNWRINSVTKLTGTKFSQVGSPAGNYLSIVNTDATLTGDGTAASPLSVVQSYELATNKKTTLADNSDTFYPSQKAVKTAVDLKEDSANKKQTVTNSATDYPSGAAVTTALATKQNTIGYTPENEANKRTTFQAAPTNTAYPSEKLVKDSLDLKADKSTVTQKIYLMLYEVATVVTGVITAVKKLWTEYSDRVTADSGTTTSLTNTERIYKMMVDNGMFNYLQFGWAADGGYKPRTSGILTFFTKIYNFFGTSDAAQTTALNQPYRFFNGSMKNPNNGNTFMAHPIISFAAGQQWSVTAVVNWAGSANHHNAFCGVIGTHALFVRRSIENRFVIHNGTAEFHGILGGSNRLIGKTMPVTFVASGTSLLVYVNGVLVDTITIPSTTMAFRALMTGRTAWPNFHQGEIHYHAIYSTALTVNQVAAEHTLLRSLYPEIPSATIGSQTWQLYNNEMVATPMGNVIQEMQAAANVNKLTDTFDTPANWFIEGESTITGGVARVYSSAGAMSSIRHKTVARTVGKYYKYTFNIIGTSIGTTTIGNVANEYFIPPGSTGLQEIYVLANETAVIFKRTLGLTDLTFDDLVVEEVGWAGSTALYNAIYAQTSGTVAQKTTAALRAAAMLSYYNNDGAVGSWAGKLYNWYAVALMQEDIDAYNVANPSTPWGWRGTLDADWVGLESDELKLDGETYWAVGNTGTNETGFAALPAGYRNAKGEFIELYNKAIFWNTDSNPTAVEKAFGFSMRLIKV